MSVGLSSELLLADVILERGLASAGDVAAALQHFWNHRRENGPSFGDVLAERTGLSASALQAAEAETRSLIEQAGGEVRHALAARGRLDRAAHLTLGARLRNGLDPRDALNGSDPAAGLRTAPDERFAECLVAGEGGMGIVYMVFDTELKRFVALKMIRPPGPDGKPLPPPESPYEVSPPAGDSEYSENYGELQRRFLQEAWITGGLEHPGIVPVYELGRTTQGMPFYTMRFVGGHRTLADAIQDAAGASAAERLTLIEPWLKVCDAVEYAHSRGVIHRDLKPSNIALGEYGEVLVLDWGLAKIGEEDATAPATWKEHIQDFRATEDFETQVAAVGTPGFMAPEAILSEAGILDARSDVYSLGAILYELLTGRLPHEFRTPLEWVDKVSHTAIKEPSELDPAIPAGLSALAMAALATDPAERPQGAGQLAERARAWQIANEASRELDRLERDARDAMASALQSRGDERLRHVERATHRLREVVKRKPDSRTAPPLLEEAERLRARGLRERTWKAVRTPVLSLVLLLAAILVTTYVLDRAERKAQLKSVEGAVETSAAFLREMRPEETLASIDSAQVLLNDVDPHSSEDTAWARATRRRLLTLAAGAQILKGDVEGLCLVATEALVSDVAQQETEGRCLVLGEAFTGLGLHDVSLELLRDVPGPDAARLRLQSTLRVGTRAEARALAEATGDALTLRMLDRYAPLERIELPEVRAVTVVEISGRSHVAALTEHGRLFLRDADTRALREVALLADVPLESPRFGPTQPGRALISGQVHSKAPGRGQATDQYALIEVDFETGLCRTLRRDNESTPRIRSLDLDADGTEELVLLFNGRTRGIEVLDMDGTPWPQERLGAAATLHVGNSSTHRSDIYDALVSEHDVGMGRSLLFATGPWNTRAFGYGVQSYPLPHGIEASSATKHRVLGSIESLLLGDLDGDGTSEIYGCNSYYPKAEHGAALGGFLPAGVYQLNPHTLEATAVDTAQTLGFYRTGSRGLSASEIYRTTTGHCSARLDTAHQLLVCSSATARPSETGPNRRLELLFHEEGRAVSWIVPELVPMAATGAATSGDVVEGSVGDELIVATGTAIVLLGQRDQTVEPLRREGSAPEDERPLTERLIERVRGKGYPEVAAKMYATLGSASETPSERISRLLRVVDCSLEARDVDGAQRALEEADAAGGLSPIERAVREAQIAVTAHRPVGARAAYDNAAALLAKPALTEALTKEVGAARVAELQDHVAQVRKRIRTGSRVFRERLDHKTLAAAGARLPAHWVATRPAISQASQDPRGLRIALHGRRRDRMVFKVNTPPPRSVRVRARIIVEDLPYGSQLGLAFSIPELPGESRGKENLYAALDRGDARPRGFSGAGTIGGDYAPTDNDEQAEHIWRWGVPIEIEIAYHRGLGQALWVLRNGMTGKTLRRWVIPYERAMAGGEYSVGLWGSPYPNPWQDVCRFVLQEFECEIETDGEEEVRIVPPGEPDSGHEIFRDAWALRADGKLDAAAALLVERLEPEILAPLLVGPRPDTATDLVRACLEGPRGPAIRQALVEGLVGTDPLLGMDTRLLAELYLADALSPGRDLEPSMIGHALSATGRLREAWPLLDHATRPPIEDPTPQERLQDAWQHYADADALERYLDPLLQGDEGEAMQRDALKLCIRGALIRGAEASARTRAYVASLLASPALVPESLRDDPSLWRLLEESK